MPEPTWARVSYPKIDFQNLYYYAAPKSTEGPKSLDEIDPDSLTVHGGQVDLAALAGVQAPLERVRSSLNDLDARLGQLRSPWIVAPSDHSAWTLAAISKCARPPSPSIARPCHA